jgi:hypothetical protein
MMAIISSYLRLTTPLHLEWLSQSPSCSKLHIPGDAADICSEERMIGIWLWEKKLDMQETARNILRHSLKCNAYVRIMDVN